MSVIFALGREFDSVIMAYKTNSRNKKEMEKLPRSVTKFATEYPEVWRAFNQLGDQCHQAGPLDEKMRRLVKIGLAVGAGLEGATHSAVRNAIDAAITAEEIRHVVVLSMTTLGFPEAIRAMMWVDDCLSKVE